ncbi:MAG: NusG domain II-containing protein [Endomicrobiia bacterium]
MNKRLVIGDIVVGVVILFFPATYFFISYTEPAPSSQVLISTDDKKDELFSLDIVTEIIKNNVKIVINSRKVKVTESSCQNKTCIKTGSIKNPGQLIVCVPNKVVIKIVSNKKKFDSLGY